MKDNKTICRAAKDNNKYIRSAKDMVYVWTAIAQQLPAFYQRRMLMAQKDKKRNYRSNGNREYKSDVISMMLQIPEYALDVYNAMNDSAYTDPDMKP